MQLKDYFDFLAPDDIRIKGSRIGIESVLYEFIHRAQTPEAIAERFHTITLEQVYATILYYLHNREAIEAYLADYLDYCHRAEKEFRENTPPRIAALHERVAERIAQKRIAEEEAKPLAKAS